MRRADEAVSEAIGTVLMVAMVVVMASAVYLFVSAGSQQGAAPTAVGLSRESGSSPTQQSFLVASLAKPTRWADVTLLLEGAPMTYDATLSGAAKYCVILTGTTCVPTAGWDPTAQIEAGQRIVVHDTSLSGDTLRLVDPLANSILLELRLS